MSTRSITPRLAGRLCSLAESQLQTQAARSVALDTSALDDRELEESLLDDLEADIEINEQALARKVPLFDRALILLVLAITTELAGLLS
jgi:hypothetical protein